MAAPLAVVYHPEMLEHWPLRLEPEMRDSRARKLRMLLGPLVTSGPWKPPERPERLSAMVAVARKIDDGRVAWSEPMLAGDEACFGRIRKDICDG